MGGGRRRRRGGRKADEGAAAAAVGLPPQAPTTPALPSPRPPAVTKGQPPTLPLPQQLEGDGDAVAAALRQRRRWRRPRTQHVGGGDETAGGRAALPPPSLAAVDADEAALAADNAFTAATDWALRTFVVCVIPLSANLLTGWRARAVLAGFGVVSAALAVHAALFPPPGPAAPAGTAAAWRRRRDGATILLRLVYAVGINRAIAAAWGPTRGPDGPPAPPRPGPSSWPAFLAGRHAVFVTFVLTLSARLPPRIAYAVAAAQSLLLLLTQRRACVGVMANRPGTRPFFLAAAAAGRAGVRAVVGALLSDGLAVGGEGVGGAGAAAPTPPACPDPTTTSLSCLATMTAIHWAALSAGLAVRFRTLPERAAHPGRRSLWGTAWRVVIQAAAAGLAGVVVADLL